MNEYAASLVDGKYGYPGVAVSGNDGNYFLFDCGESVKNRIGGSVTHVFLSHHHIDHFLGFDRVIAQNIGSKRTIQVFGPEDTIRRVAAKVSAYHWNLAAENSFRFEVHELLEDAVNYAQMGVPQDLDHITVEERPDIKGIVYLGSEDTLTYARLDHDGIASVAYALKKKDKIRIDKERFEAQGFTPGPWVKELMGKCDSPEETVVTNRGEVQIGDLVGVTFVEKGGKFVYATDFLYSRENTSRLKSIGEGADILYCEAKFLAEDIERATDYHHLTAKQAGFLAAQLGVKELRLFHHSRRYSGQEEKFIEEAKRVFKGMIV